MIRKIVTALFSCSILLLCNCASNDTETSAPIVTQYTLSVSAGEGGSVNITGGTYNEGEEVTITATSEAAYEFTNWSNGSEENPLTVTMTEDLEISANFSSIPTTKSFEINVTANSARNYTLLGTDRNGPVSGDDPSLTFTVGDQIKFNVDAPSHPFLLKTVPGTNYNNLIPDVINNGDMDGTVEWTPIEAGTYYYQCRPHITMVGTITIQQSDTL